MTQHTGKGHVPGERLREILDALGMAPTRDWDDVLNAARCLHKNASGDAVAPGEQPDDEVARLRSVLAGRERELKAALTQVHELRTAADTGQALRDTRADVVQRLWSAADLAKAVGLDELAGALTIAFAELNALASHATPDGLWDVLANPSPPQHNHDAKGVYGGCPACGTVFAEPSGDTVQAPADLVEAARAWARWIDEGHGSAINHVTAPIYDAVAKLDYEQPADTVQASPAEIAGWDGAA